MNVHDLDIAAQLESFPTREAWLEARRGYGIGSSDVPAILGVSRFQSPLALYHEKLGLKAEHPGTAEQREWGLRLEEPISQHYAAITKRSLWNPNAGGAWTIARSVVHPFMLASVDRFIIGTGDRPLSDDGPKPPADGIGVLEVKNAHLFMADEWGPENNNEPPVEYQLQAQHQLAVTGLQWCSIVALIGGVRFVWADIPRDNDLIVRLVDLETEFMRRLVDRDPPPADGSDSSREILKALYPRDKGTVVELPIEALEWHNELAAAKKDEKDAAARKALNENLLKQAIGDATLGVIPGGTTYSYKLQSRAEFVSKATEFRVLRVKGGK